MEVAKLHENTLSAIYKTVQGPRISTTQLRITFPPSPKANQNIKAITPYVARSPLNLNKTPSLETLRDKKLCYSCHEKWATGHKYKTKALNTLEGSEGETTVEKG